MKAKKLTATTIKTIKPPKSGRKTYWDALVPGFGVQVTDKGAQTWLFMGRLRGSQLAKLVKLSFGRPGSETIAGARIYSLADARRRAGELKGQLDRGIDPRTTSDWHGLRQKSVPSEEPDSEHAAGSFGALVDEYREKHLKPNTRCWKDHDRNIRLYLSNWMKRSYREITADDLLEITDRLLAAGKPGAANDAHDLANRVLNWAVNRRKLDASPLTGLKRPAKQKSRDRALDEDEIAALWNARLDKIPGAFVKLLLITGQRRATVAGTRWAEVEAEEKAWHIPGDRMKNGEAHTVPLPQIALAILEGLPRYKDGPYVFSTSSGKKPISGYSKMKATIDKTVELAPWGFHDLRRTMATQMAKLGIQQHVVEKLLDHRSGKISGIAAVYNRHEYRDEMRSAVDEWSVRLNEISEKANKDKPTSNAHVAEGDAAAAVP